MSGNQSFILGQSALYRWYEQVAETVSEGHAIPSSDIEVNLRLLGQGLIVEGNDCDAYLEFLRWTCTSLEIDLLCVKTGELEGLREAISTITSTPLIVFIEPNYWLDGDDVSESDYLEREILKEFFELIRGKPLIFTSICSSYEAIAEVFRYQGRFDKYIRWSPSNPKLYAQDFIDRVGVECLDEALICQLERLGNLLCLEFPSMRSLGLLSIAVQRKSASTSRKIGWKDLMEFAIHGTGDGPYELGSGIDMRQISVHEAGHALMAIIESNGENLPDWVSILPGKNTIGMVVEDYTAGHNSDKFMSFSRVRSSIRIAIAGRVAEELILGRLHVGAGCSTEDLREATKNVMHLIARNGFSSSYATGLYEGESLLVAFKNYVSADSEYFHIQARQFMSDQYQYVTKTLEGYLPLLIRIQEALLKDRLLLKCDLEKLVRGELFDDRLAA